MLNQNNKNTIQTIISNECIDYPEAIAFMEKRVEKIRTNINSELIWLLHHPSIYTVGKSSNNSDFLKNPQIPIYKTDRGGQITYHGPGQRIAYFMINLNNKRKDVRYFINLLEKITIDTLKEFNIIAESRSDRIGIWVTKYKNKILNKEKKIGSIGIKIRKWITYHGVSININPDLNYFKLINPCGIKDFSVTSLQELGVDPKISEFDNIFIKKSYKYLLI